MIHSAFLLGGRLVNGYLKGIRSMLRLKAKFTLVCFAALVWPSFATGRTVRPAILAAGLGGLPLERSGAAAHAGSWDRHWRNYDFRSLAPGHRLVLLHYRGAGVVRHFWCTFTGGQPILCQAILRMYWDGEKHPSVRVPLGAFFGVGFGQQVNYESAPLEETSGGNNCWWPMPFHKSAYWTLTNESKETISAFYWNINFDTYRSLPSRLLEFHALWRQENPVPRGKNYLILDTTGRGQYVGTALFMQGLAKGLGLSFLEGNPVVYIDGRRRPAIVGTGTEDYFCSGWYFATGPYSAPYHGCLLKQPIRQRVSAYRWNILDPIPFHRSIKFTIQVGPMDNIPAAYASVAYWYQTQPHPVYPPLPPPASLLPVRPVAVFAIPGALEARGLVRRAHATSGIVQSQNMADFNGRWSDDAQLFWHGQSKAAKLTIPLPVAKAGDYFLTAYFTKAPDYGRFQIFVGGHKVGSVIDGYARSVQPSGPVCLGKIVLRAGGNPLVVKIVGRDRRSANYFFGLNALVLKPVGR